MGPYENLKYSNNELELKENIINAYTIKNHNINSLGVKSIREKETEKMIKTIIRVFKDVSLPKFMISRYGKQEKKTKEKKRTPFNL